MKKENKINNRIAKTYGENYVPAFINNDNKIIKLKLLETYNGRGYEIPAGSKFWKIEFPDENKGLYGLQVGNYVHSCHIDTTDLLVLLVIRGYDSYVESFSDIWLTNLITI